MSTYVVFNIDICTVVQQQNKNLVIPIQHCIYDGRHSNLHTWYKWWHWRGVMRSYQINQPDWYRQRWTDFTSLLGSLLSLLHHLYSRESLCHRHPWGLQRDIQPSYGHPLFCCDQLSWWHWSIVAPKVGFRHIVDCPSVGYQRVQKDCWYGLMDDGATRSERGYYCLFLR